MLAAKPKQAREPNRPEVVQTPRRDVELVLGPPSGYVLVSKLEGRRFKVQQPHAAVWAGASVWEGVYD